MIRKNPPDKAVQDGLEQLTNRFGILATLSKRAIVVPILLLSILLLLTAYIPAAMPQSVILQRLQPQLRTVVLAHPEKKMTVIVQKTAPDAPIEELVVKLGGVVTKDLHILRAFAAKLSGSAVLQLAANPQVRWIFLDGPVESAGRINPTPSVATTNSYLDTLNVRPLWNQGLRGNGIGVAVIDSGLSPDKDFTNVVRSMSFNPNSQTPIDIYGHGNHVAGIIAGNGSDSAGAYMGIAPNANLFSLKISDEVGLAYESDVVAALQWVYDNKAAYNIRVVNLSLNSVVEQSYHLSPMNAAAEILWFNGIVVVASAGNKGPAGGYNTMNAAPANDPFLITVGGADEHGTSNRSDDTLGPYSSWGTTVDGYNKPELYAPGSNIYSVTSKQSPWTTLYPERTVVNGEYFRLTGTSMAAPMVTGAIALLLQDEPNLTPDQVKYRLMATAPSTIDWVKGKGKSAEYFSYPYLDVYAAVTGNTTQSANTGLVASQLLWTGNDPLTWGSVSWNSVSWNSVSWNSVSWNSVSWNSVAWNSVAWDDGSNGTVSGAALATPDDVANAESDENTLDAQAGEKQKSVLFLPLISR